MFEKALQSNACWTWHHRDIALRQLQPHEEALNSFDRSIEFNPDSFLTWHYRGLTLNNLGKYKSAIASFQKAKELANITPKSLTAAQPKINQPLIPNQSYFTPPQQFLR